MVRKDPLQQKFTENARSGCRLSFANSFGDSVTDYLPSARTRASMGLLSYGNADDARAARAIMERLGARYVWPWASGA